MKVGDLVKYPGRKVFILNDLNLDHINDKTIEQVFKNGATEITKKYSSMEHSYLIDLIDKSKKLSKKLSEKEIQAVASYFITLEPERGMQFWEAMSKGVMENTVGLHYVASSYIVNMCQNYPPWDESVNRDQIGVVVSHTNPEDHGSEENWYQIYWTDQTKTEVLEKWMEVVGESR